MPRSTDLSRYPEQYTEFATRFEESEGELMIPSENAGADRLELYSFRAALRKSDKAKDFPRFDAAEIIADKANHRVIVRTRDKTPTAIALAKAMANNFKPKDDNRQE